MSIQFYDQGVLTINGVSSPVTDVSVSFGDDARPAMPAPIVSPLRMAFEGEMGAGDWEAFMAAMPAPMWPQWLLVEYAGDSAHVPIFEHDTRETLERRITEAVRGLCLFTACRTVTLRCARWRLRRAKRHEKAKAKREKMRAARYAARWEQAHLRGGK